MIGPRGRFHLLPRWAKRLDWLPVPAKAPDDALIVFEEPGKLSIRNWNPDGPEIISRFHQLAQDGDLELLRLIQDRYARLSIPRERRVYLGSQALQHLSLPLDRKLKSSVYVVVSANRIDLISPNLRNELLVTGNPELDDLP